MISSADRMRAMASAKAQSESDRALFRACLAVFRASGWWSDEQIAEYTGIAGQIMNGDDEEAKQAAREYWIAKTA